MLIQTTKNCEKGKLTTRLTKGKKQAVESEEEQGSISLFTIPCNSETGKINVITNVVSADRTETQIKNLKILIVEDDELSIILITRFVKILGEQVLKARNGAEAVEACLNNPDIDLVLMDIRMPVMDGYEATRRIRQFNKDVVIIAQTASASTGDRERAIEAGCNDYISKPLGQALLTGLILKQFEK